MPLPATPETYNEETWGEDEGDQYILSRRHGRQFNCISTGVGIGQEVALRPAMMLLFDSSAFCTKKGLQLYLCKQLLGSPKPLANATSGEPVPPTQRPLLVPVPNASRMTPRKGPRLGAGHPKGGSAESLREVFIFGRHNHITGRHHENCQPN